LDSVCVEDKKSLLRLHFRKVVAFKKQFLGINEILIRVKKLA